MKNRFTITMLTSFIMTYLCLKNINLNIDKKLQYYMYTN